MVSIMWKSPTKTFFWGVFNIRDGIRFSQIWPSGEAGDVTVAVSLGISNILVPPFLYPILDDIYLYIHLIVYIYLFIYSFICIYKYIYIHTGCFFLVGDIKQSQEC